MNNSTFRAGLILFCTGCLTFCYAGAAIGIAMINGIATVDHSNVRGNTTVLDGSVVETSKGYSQLSLNGGARVELGAASRGVIYRDHVVLEQGMGQLHGGNFLLFANALHVAAYGADASVRVSVKDKGIVQVGAVTGEARVMDSRGLLLAKALPGLALEFGQDRPAGVMMPRGPR